MKMIYPHKLISALFFLVSLNMMGQNFGKITGKITLSDNAPAESIAIALKNTRYNTTTNFSGQYEIKNSYCKRKKKRL